MSSQISEVSFGVFVQGRNLTVWEWEAVDLLRAGGATCQFILGSTTPTHRARYSSHILSRMVAAAAGLPAETSQPIEPQDQRKFHPLTVYSVKSSAECGPDITGLQANHRLKFILFFGTDEIPQDLPGSAEWGVWRFTGGAGSGNDYPFVSGLHRRTDVVSFGLERIASSKSNSPRLLLAGHFRARGQANRAVVSEILAEAARWPLRVLKHILLNGELPADSQSSSDESIRYNPVVLILSLLWRDIFVQLKSKLASYFLLETWNIGFARMSFQTLMSGADLSGIVMLPRRELGRYIADPFILSTVPELTLLAEDYTDFGVGRIAEVTVRDPFGKPEVGLQVRLESQHHMSYPFVFREKGTTYCLPECYQSNASILYRYDDGKLLPVSDLIPGARATDGTILFHEGRYWLFCGLENDSDQVNLHLFFSDTLSGKWSAHPLNPVKTDVRSSRSAGPVIVQNGVLFRPTQDCSKSYGYGLSINRIDRLTVTRFEETVVANIKPEAISGSCKGLHTLSFAGDMMVIDAKFNLIGLEPVLVRAVRWVKRLNARMARRFAY